MENGSRLVIGLIVVWLLDLCGIIGLATLVRVRRFDKSVTGDGSGLVDVCGRCNGDFSFDKNVRLFVREVVDLASGSFVGRRVVLDGDDGSDETTTGTSGLDGSSLMNVPCLSGNVCGDANFAGLFVVFAGTLDLPSSGRPAFGFSTSFVTFGVLTLVDLLAKLGLFTRICVFVTMVALSALATIPLRSSNALLRAGRTVEATVFFVGIFVTDSLLYGETYADFFLPRIAFVSGDFPLSSVQFDS